MGLRVRETKTYAFTIRVATSNVRVYGLGVKVILDFS